MVVILHSSHVCGQCWLRHTLMARIKNQRASEDASLLRANMRQFGLLECPKKKTFIKKFITI